MAAAIFQPCHLPSTFISILFFLSFTSPLFSLISSSSSDFVFHRQFLQSNSPQNIETVFPSGAAPPFFPPNPPALSPSNPNKPSETPRSSAPTKIQETSRPPEKTTGRTVAKAVVATAASTIVFAGIFFFFLQRCVLARRRQPEKIQKANMSTRPDETSVSYSAFNVLDGTLKELVVDENGLDVLYWRKLHRKGQGKNGFQKEVLGQPDEGRRVHGKADLHLKSDPNVKIQSFSTMSSSSTVGVLPELRGTSPVSPPPGLCSKNSAFSSQNLPESRDPYGVFSHPSAQSSNQSSQIQSIPKDPDRFFSPPKSNSLESSSQIQPGIGGTNSISAATDTATPIAAVAMARPTTQIPVPLPQHPKFEPPPPPQPTRAPPPPPPPQPPRAPPPPPPPQPPRAPPPPPTAAVKKAPAPPPLPPIKNLVPPPPPPRASGTKPPPSPPASKGKSSSIMTSEPSSTDSSKERNTAKAKMKPLHWDKFVANADHSMVWDKIGSGSFRFDDDLMEALFGYASTNMKSTDENKNLENTSKANSNETLKSCLLDPRKSQNIAIVLKSLHLSRQEILDALLNGNGLNADTLEKLTKIAPTKEEETMILEFSGDPSKLADAESFLYHLVRNAPSPFLRLDAMFFKSNYDSEILHLKESLQTLESACKELRTRGLFLKLLEAVLKAGNRMNAGTARGNAQAFNLAALCKLSDVKSTDGKTTLLHFVVEEVVRLEGKRCVINRNHSLGRSNSKLGSNTMGKEERDREYIMLGLPLVGGLSVEFSNVKKAATIDYGGFVNACKTLTARINGIRQFLGGQNVGRGDTFVREMKGFLEAAEEELKVVKEEETRVMELVKRTTGYYQSGASKDRGAHQLQLFIIVKDFLCMVDQACIDIARSQQQKKKLGAGFGGSSPPQRPAQRVPLRFPNLPTHFLSDNSKTSSDSEDDC